MALGFAPFGVLSLALSGAKVAFRHANRIVRTLINRRDIVRLAELDDRCLKDIGLVRSDVMGALAEPLYVDPSAILRVRSVDGRVRPLSVVTAKAWRGSRPVGTHALP